MLRILLVPSETLGETPTETSNGGNACGDNRLYARSKQRRWRKVFCGTGDDPTTLTIKTGVLDDTTPPHRAPVVSRGVALISTRTLSGNHAPSVVNANTRDSGASTNVSLPLPLFVTAKNCSDSIESTEKTAAATDITPGPLTAGVGLSPPIHATALATGNVALSDGRSINIPEEFPG